jgi:phosphoribosylformylglycinamidine synthase
VLAAQACYDVAVAYGTPFISGKDSLNNEYTHEGRSLAIPPTLLISAIGIVPDIRSCVTMDLKEPGNAILIVGVTRGELGGSVWADLHQAGRGEAPRVDAVTGRLVFDAVHAAISGGLVRACHDLSEGGLAVALAEMALASGLGASISLTDVPRGPAVTDDVALLFSESPTRFLLEVRPDRLAELERVLAGVPHARIGEVLAGAGVVEAGLPRFVVLGLDGREVVNAGVSDLKAAWQATFRPG